MTERKATELLATAKQFLGQDITLDSVVYTFFDTLSMKNRENNDPWIYSLWAKLKTTEGKVIEKPLGQIVAEFENNPK